MSRSRSYGGDDLEKEAFRISRSSDDNDYDEDTPSTISSRVTSSTYQHTQSRAYSSPSRYSFLLHRPNSIIRWICWGVAASLLIFMFWLVKLSWNSDKQVKIAIEMKEDSPKPSTWESFPFLERYYGGIRSLVPYASNQPEYPGDADGGTVEFVNKTIEKRAAMESVKFDPYPDYRSESYIGKYGRKVDCFLDKEGQVDISRVRVYEGVPNGLPDQVMGSSAMLGIRHDICYERFGRLGPYGLGYGLARGGTGAQQAGEREGADTVWQEVPEVDFRTVKWGDTQERCVAANKHRFADLPTPRIDRFRAMQVGKIDRPPTASAAPATSQSKRDLGHTEKLPRTAVVIRTWREYRYTPEDLMYLRSIISELSLLSGGEYIVHFLIQVKDDNAPIWSDDSTYDEYLQTSLPSEFEGMGTLWSEKQMGLMYGGLAESWMRDLPVHGVYRSTFMPMQYFAYQHPEYDFFWNWEMDIRNTGHWYNLFDAVSKWTKAQPRKFLWERNARFFIPSEHGTWEEFSQMIRFQTEKGTNSANNIWSGLGAGKPKGEAPGTHIGGDPPIWGPERPLDDNVEMENDVNPPTTFEKDKYTWGVGEDADLITFNPTFDPDGTEWLLAEDTTGYNVDQGLPPRRTAIITASRLSKRLLLTMHKETALKHHTMFSEMWPASCALHHGFKVVYAPHSEYIDRRWPTNYLESVFNAGRNGATGGARTSVWGESRLHNFRGTSWYYNAGFPEVIWNRWLGYKFNGEGGEAFEVNGEGRMCLPPMLLHPIKRVEMVIEGLRDGR